MKKSMILFLLLVIAYGHGAGANASAAQLRNSTTTEYSVIRVSDIFNLQDNDKFGKIAGTIVGAAPAPGRKKILNSFQLSAIARRHGINWRPTSRHDRTVISRSGTLISVQEIENAVSQALINNGMDQEFSAKLNNVSHRIYAAENQEVPFTIERAHFNRRTGRITATLRIHHGNSETRDISLIGRIVKFIRVPVLLRRIKAGDIIRKSDIGWVELDARRLRDSFETDAESLINQQAVRSLSVGKPIRTRDIRSRVLVTKGSLATLTLRTDRMLLTVKVLAMGDGGLGETVRVLNTRSKKMVEGIVTGAGQIVMPTLGFGQGS